MDPTTPLSSRKNATINSAKRFANNLSERLTQLLFTKRRASSENENVVIKRRRSAASDGCPVPSPVSVNESPIRSYRGRLTLSSPPSYSTASTEENSTTFGILEKLPYDAVEYFLRILPYDDMGSLALTSKGWFKLINTYIYSPSFTSRIYNNIDEYIINPEDKFEVKHPCYLIGLLISKISAYENVLYRKLSLLKYVLGNIYNEYKNYSYCGKVIYGFVINTANLSAYAYKEIINVCFDIDSSLILNLDNLIVQNNFGNGNLSQRRQQELQVRQNIHELFLSNDSSDPKSTPNCYFLGTLVARYKANGTTSQSRLMYLLYAPFAYSDNETYINWEAFGDVVIDSREDAEISLKPLASALRALVLCKKTSYGYPWSNNSIFNLIEEMTTYPSPWSMNTFASFLLMEPSLIAISIITRMIRDHEDEAGDMVCTMKLLLHRWDISIVDTLSNPLKSIRASLPRHRRVLLCTKVWRWHQRNLEDLRYRSGSAVESRAELESQLEFNKLLLQLIG